MKKNPKNTHTNNKPPTKIREIKLRPYYGLEVANCSLKTEIILSRACAPPEALCHTKIFLGFKNKQM